MDDHKDNSGLEDLDLSIPAWPFSYNGPHPRIQKEIQEDSKGE